MLSSSVITVTTLKKQLFSLLIALLYMAAGPRYGIENVSYLIELVVDEPVDQGWLSDPAVPDEDDVAVVPGLRQTVAYTAHHRLIVWTLFL